MGSRPRSQSAGNPQTSYLREFENYNYPKPAPIGSRPPPYQHPGNYHGTEPGQPVIIQQPGPQAYGSMGYVGEQPRPDLIVLPSNHAVLAWLTCLFCCWPLGLVAVLDSFKVDTAISKGDLLQARDASISARKFAYLSIGFGVSLLATAGIVVTVFIA